MARDIVVDPDQLTGLANDVVGELSVIERSTAIYIVNWMVSF